MELKEMLKENFNNTKEITKERYKASKVAFLTTAFLFFLNFYFVWAKFYSDFFDNTLWISYILLLLSMFFYIYFLIKNKFVEKFPEHLFKIIFIVLLVFFIILLLPAVFKWWLFWILWLSK